MSCPSGQIASTCKCGSGGSYNGIYAAGAGTYCCNSVAYTSGVSSCCSGTWSQNCGGCGSASATGAQWRYNSNAVLLACSASNGNLDGNFQVSAACKCGSGTTASQYAAVGQYCCSGATAPQSTPCCGKLGGSCCYTAGYYPYCTDSGTVCQGGATSGTCVSCGSGASAQYCCGTMPCSATSSPSPTYFGPMSACGTLSQLTCGPGSACETGTAHNGYVKCYACGSIGNSCCGGVGGNCPTSGTCVSGTCVSPNCGNCVINLGTHHCVYPQLYYRNYNYIGPTTVACPIGMSAMYPWMWPTNGGYYGHACADGTPNGYAGICCDPNCAGTS